MTMDADRRSLLGELAADAALERTDFLVRATEQLQGFLDRHEARLRELGGMVLIDEDPDYLSIAPDGSFRSRSRFQDQATGAWVSDTEVIDSVAELVELYNPADVLAAFAEAAREEAGMPEEPTAAEGLMEAAGIAPDETVSLGTDPYAGAADDWAAAQSGLPEVTSDDEAARALYDLSLSMQERSQQSEARLIEQFEDAAARLTGRLGDFIIVDDDDERLTLRSTGSFVAEVVPEDAEGTWRSLTSPDEIVQFYDPTDVFGDLAEALAEAYPDLAQEDGKEGAVVISLDTNGTAPAGDEDGEDREDVEQGDEEEADAPQASPDGDDGRRK
jgi:hypothetical protein